MARYFFHGDGRITLYGERVNRTFSGVYRKGLESYDEKALNEICRVFEAPFEAPRMGLSLRLIEFIDYLEDRLNRGARITIVSGYRKPKYNTLLREKGNLAAKASLHQYGMAADLKIQGVEAETLWHYVRNVKFGGAGYYHGDVVHIDVGPSRFWDETTSGVGTGISDGNKLIGIITDYDVYCPGMTVILRFIRMTAFPILVIPEFSLVRQDDRDKIGNRLDFTPVFSLSQKKGCMSFDNIDDMNNIKWELPMDLRPGRYRIEARFCGDAWPDMPRQIETPVFEITKPQ
ncbi:MAG: YcbK family protein [Deltaproteobacteria bacterium]|nr:YcbK family protein [Deltaproteobacteria bacterium]